MFGLPHRCAGSILMIFLGCGGCGRSEPGVTKPRQANPPQISNSAKPSQDNAASPDQTGQLTTGVAASREGKNEAVREFDPLVAFLKTHFASEIERGSALVIEDKTDLSGLLFRGMAFEELVNGSLNGDGRIYVMKKQDDHWVEIKIRFGPWWVS
jgi:hypothetical protein